MELSADGAPNSKPLSQDETTPGSDGEGWDIEVTNLERFIVQTRGMVLDAFLEEFPDPVLVVEPFQLETDATFRTIQAKATSLSDWVVLPVKKRANANPFGLMVTVGRAGNNDLRIPAPDISKFHAYFVPKKSTVADANSTFGTFLEGERLEPRRATPIQCGARLRMGPVQMLYLSPEGFHEHLKTLKMP